MAAPDKLAITAAPSQTTPAPGSGPRAPARAPSAGRASWLPVLFVAVLAALLASFPARNTDLWRHLAAGRLVAEGESPAALVSRIAPGVRPGQTWLYDLICYGLFATVGGAGLMLGKALLVVGVGLVLVRLGRAGQGWGVAAVCASLALLAMSTRLPLQPVTVSCLMLALALWCVRPRGEAPGALPGALPPWPLLVLFVVWVNVGPWAVLGLLTVALVWLGRALDLARQGAEQADKKPEEAPGAGKQPPARHPVTLSPCHLVTLSLLAGACLLSPSGVWAFALPGGLGPLASPFERAFLVDFRLGPADLAYFLLLGLSLLSFALNRSRWSWQRFLPWLALAVLSGLQGRFVPFFAVVAGPALARNLQEYLAARPQRERLWGREFAALSAPAWLLAVVCLVCAWPGWLSGAPFEPRRWDLDFSASLERGAATTRLWRQHGKLRPDRRGLHLSPESAAAFAWFYPEDTALVDDDLTRALADGRVAPTDLAARLRAAGVDHVIVYDPNRNRLVAALARLAAAEALARLTGSPGEWPLLYQEGELAVFGWRDPAQRGPGSADPFPGLELDLSRLAFHPTAATKAPRKRPEREPARRRWWDAFWKPVPPRSLDTEEATLHLFHAEAHKPSAPLLRVGPWDLAQSAALVGTLAAWRWPAVVVEADLGLVLAKPEKFKADAKEGKVSGRGQVALLCQQWWAQTQDDSPPALLYVALRAARRAVAANPDDALAHLALGECYLRLLLDTRERDWARYAPQLRQLRLTQATAALNHAVALQPDLAQAHLRLAEIYQLLGYLDLRLNHLRAYERLTREAGGGAREDDSLAREVSRLAEWVAKAEQEYAAEADKLRLLDRVRMLFEKGLRGKARDLLLESDASAFSEKGTQVELRLLLETGRAKQVREWTQDTPDLKTLLGASAFHWMRAQALAASGDYQAAEEECEQLALASRGGEGAQPREMMALLLAERILDTPPAGAPWPELRRYRLNRLDYEGPVMALAARLANEANANVFRGLLALEEGRIDEAEVSFRLALAAWKSDAAAASGAGLSFNTRPIAQGYLRLLEDAAARTDRQSGKRQDREPK
jgi:hypothetical protein